MTPEEVEKTIQQMLAIQRQIQETQLNAEQKISDLSDKVEGLSDNVAGLFDLVEGLSNNISGLYEISKTHSEAIAALIENSKQQDRRLEQLIGYSITAASERLDMAERMRIMENKVKKLQNNQ